MTAAPHAPRTPRALPLEVGLLDLVLCWTAGLVGYLVAEYGAGALLAGAVMQGGTGALPAWVWLPWLAGPLLCGAAAGAMLALLGAPVRWWHWPLAGAVVPLAAAPVTWFVTRSAVGGEIVVGVLVQVLVAGLVAAGVGALAHAFAPLLARRRSSAPPPASYTS